ncbi:hypothetical protein EPUS_02718 [Endocarpon pusillum Z07020]|uniref:Polynucleotide 5'-hydroxyl-kinase GRC3 n=1 Tax=Endocarpon pusillum (strain Z07020 / HMAS-L-300199) TaxID=1263415 RepID=U1FU16_ENDPU|nr:uncharacterized protein EPUS_02718 [Endocarpon pusillum Z07020]ERF68262.1 hypothetical protein EPUS_02718 [Endocarpon pusillum Z07020]
MHSRPYESVNLDDILFGAGAGFDLRNVMSLPGLGLPGLGLEEPSEQPQTTETTQQELSSGSEWRFEVAFGKCVKVRLLNGTAEIFGTELIEGPTYTFTGTKAAIFTHHGCTLEISNDAPQSEYSAEETPMAEYVNVHFALETLRNEAQARGRDGPRVLVLGPSNAGKTSLLKTLTAYAIRLGRQPIIVNLDPEEGVLSLPGTLTAVAIRALLDVEEGWGSSPMSGPSAIPVKLPLVYNYGLSDPVADDKSAAHYKAVLSKLALAVSGRLSEDPLAKEAGVLIDTPGTLANTTKSLASNIIQHIVSEFSISHVLILGSERLYSDILRRFENKPTSSTTSNHHHNETITVAKLSKSGGCVDRDMAFMRAFRAAQIRAYFFGTGHLTNGITLSPRQQQVEFNQLAIYRLLIGDGDPTNASVSADLFRPGGQDDENDEDEDIYNPTTNHSLKSQHAAAAATESGDGTIFQRLTSPTPALQSHILAIMNADPDATEEDIQTSGVIGFLYVAEVDEARGRVPRRAIVWSRGWPEVVVGIV